MERFPIYYLCIFNVCTLVLFGIDKLKAKRKEYRVPEKTFFVAALFGGGAGIWAGMYLFRHKTRHWYFVWGIPLITLAEAALLLWWWFGVRG